MLLSSSSPSPSPSGHDCDWGWGNVMPAATQQLVGAMQHRRHPAGTAGCRTRPTPPALHHGKVLLWGLADGMGLEEQARARERQEGQEAGGSGGGGGGSGASAGTDGDDDGCRRLGPAGSIVSLPSPLTSIWQVACGFRHTGR
jgi:hypothetical protein